LAPPQRLIHAKGWFRDDQETASASICGADRATGRLRVKCATLLPLPRVAIELRRSPVGLAVALLLALLVCSTARAQHDAGLLDSGITVDLDAHVQGAEISLSTPPRVLFLPAIDQRADASSVQDSVEVLVRVDRLGRGELLACELESSLCSEIASALSAARFEPARIAGNAVDARVRVRFAVHTEPTSSTEPDAGVVPSKPAEPRELDAGQSALDEYGATARVDLVAPTAHRLELAELREVPGTFGDPFRVLDALPGVVPVLTGIPYVYVRGAPPASTVYFYDDIQVPALFHLALGPAVVHAAMIGPIDFYPGIAPARYGRKTGGVLTGQAANRPLADGVHGEIELRPVDLQAYVSKPFESGARIEVGGRYGYPGLLIKLFEPASVVQYWDYQLRASTPISPDTTVALTALGSYDLIGERQGRKVYKDLELQFHRVEARSVTRRRNLTLGYALAAGFERSGLSDEFEVTATRVGPRLWIESKLGTLRFRIGADMTASFGKIGDPREDSHEEQIYNPDTREFETQRTKEPDSPVHPVYRSAASRNVVGVYTEVTWPFARRFELEAGLRGDVWITGGDAQSALEPRAVLRHRPHERVGLHAAFGLAYQPAVFMLPLPGLSDVALDRGLQRAIQSELGSQLDLTDSITLETKLYLHLYEGMLSIEALDGGDVDCAGEPDCDADSNLGRMSAHSYGAELMLRRSYKELLSGWIAYTLSWADGRTDGGRALTPHFDVRHVANLVMQWRISAKWRASLRGFAQSGRFALGASTATDPMERERLPAFYRGDLQLSRIWKKRWGELRFTLDWLNFTFSREPIGWQCSDDQGRPLDACRVEYLEFPITLPLLGLRATY
jgi:hypothetical protein